MSISSGPMVIPVKSLSSAAYLNAPRFFAGAVVPCVLAVAANGL